VCTSEKYYFTEFDDDELTAEGWYETYCNGNGYCLYYDCYWESG